MYRARAQGDCENTMVATTKMRLLRDRTPRLIASQGLGPQHPNLIQQTRVELPSIFTLYLSIIRTHPSAAAQNDRLILDRRHLSLLLLHSREIRSQAPLVEVVAERAEKIALLPDLF